MFLEKLENAMKNAMKNPPVPYGKEIAMASVAALPVAGYVLRKDMKCIADATWFLGPILTGLGLLAALYADDTHKAIATLYERLALKFFPTGSTIQMSTRRSIKKKANKETYRLICLLLWVGLGFQLFADVFTGRKMGSFYDAWCIFYTYTTIYISAHDVLIDDDKKKWNRDAKFRHIVFPFNLEDNKIFGGKISETQAKGQKVAARAKIQTNLKTIATFGGLALFNHLYVPYVLRGILGFAWLPTQNAVNTIIDQTVDLIFISGTRNRFSHFFGNTKEILTDGKEDDHMGMQYQYFKYNGKFLTSTLKSKVFKKVRKAGYNVGVAKAANYLARGAVIVGAIAIAQIQDINEDYNSYKFLTMMAFYYVLHAAASYRASGKEDSYTDEKYKRNILFITEGVVATYFFYEPLCRALLDSK